MFWRNALSRYRPIWTNCWWCGEPGGCGDRRDRSNMQTCLHLPKSREYSSGKVILRNVILGRWSTTALESGSEAVEQVLMQSLKYMLIECRGGPRMLSAVYVHVARHLQKCHVSSFYGWENSIAEWQNKDPHDHNIGHKLSRFGYRFVLASAMGPCYFVCTGTAANCCLPSWLPAQGLALTVIISQLLKMFQQLCNRNKKMLLLPGWNYLVWE